jgi:hypothetical protein
VWMTYLRWGVLRLATPLGPRYVRPSFLERMYLMWVFRNFKVLRQEVLSRPTRVLIEGLCARQHSQSNGFLFAITDQPVIGTVERNPQSGSEPAPPSSRSMASASAVAFSRRPPVKGEPASGSKTHVNKGRQGFTREARTQHCIRSTPWPASSTSISRPDTICVT